jgi:hypothetical protein
LVIDVISYTDDQYAALTEEQIVKIQTVQLRKNRLAKQLEENKRKAKYKLLEAGVFRSPIWEKICNTLTEQYDAEVENLHDELMFYLQFTGQEEESKVVEASSTYTLDYGLSYAERLEVVREYYDSTYLKKLAAFKADRKAKKYLGEYYAPLYELYSADAS